MLIYAKVVSKILKLIDALDIGEQQKQYSTYNILSSNQKK
jgi:hypothetical protein